MLLLRLAWCRDRLKPPGEGHGFFDEANRAAAYELMLEFYAKNLGVAAGS